MYSCCSTLSLRLMLSSVFTAESSHGWSRDELSLTVCGYLMSLLYFNTEQSTAHPAGLQDPHIVTRTKEVSTKSEILINQFDKYTFGLDISP